MSNISDILSSNEKDREPAKLSEEKFRAYLEGNLSAEEQHEVEEWLSEEGMESDAVEGLKALDPVAAQQTVTQLNMLLRKQLAVKKRVRRKQFSDNRWALVAIGVILMLALLAYIVMRLVPGK